MDTEKCPFIGIDCEYIPLARKSDAQAKEIERLQGVLLTVLEACKDVNSPDRKVREEITRTVRKALKEKE
jgi:hypothetical protein